MANGLRSNFWIDMVTIEDITTKVVNEYIKPKFKTNPEYVGLNYHAEEHERYYCCSIHVLISDFEPDNHGIEPHLFDEDFCEYLKQNGISKYGSFHYYEFDQYGLEVIFYVDFSVVREFMNRLKLKNKNPEKLYHRSTILVI